MAANPETIIIPSSSPEQNWARSVSPCTPERLLGILSHDSSPPSLFSSSRLFKPPTATKRRAISQASQSPLREEIGKENLPITNTKKSASSKNGDKPKTVRKKGGEPEVSKESTPKPRTTARNRKGAKQEEAKNKTITGRVAKNAAPKAKDSSGKEIILLDMTGKEAPQRKARARNNLELHGLNLEEAIKRRLDWTPPKSTPFFPIDNGDITQDTGNASMFSGLFHDYSFRRVKSSIDDHAPSGTDGLPTKRRRIELVEGLIQETSAFGKRSDGSHKSTAADTNGGAKTSRDKSIPKQKRVKTITALVTSRYEPVEEYATKQNHLFEDNIADNNADDSSTKKRNKKNKKVTSTKKKEPEYIILSPEAVTKSLDSQDILFGTCSQLETDDHPTVVRETQKALAASEKITGSSFTLSSTSSQVSTKGLTSRFNGSGELWSAAARNSDGFVVQPEFIDMTTSPAIYPLKSQITFEDEGIRNTKTKDLPLTLPERTLPKETASRKKMIHVSDTNHENSSVTEHTLGSQERSSTQTSDMPRYTGFTDDELRKKVASYGFKSIKGRNKMISLLEKCWESKQTAPMSTTEDIPKTSTTTATTNSPAPMTTDGCGENQSKTKQKQPGRAKKPKTSDTSNSSSKAQKTGKLQSQSISKPSSKKNETCQPQHSSFVFVEEIQDSEDDSIPSPTRIQMRFNASRQSTPAASLPLGTRPTFSPKGTSKCPPKNTGTCGNLSELSNQITKAIRSQPRSLVGSKRGPQLTWHEKILLYDPVILEDLATWLNTEGLGLIGEDREVSAGLVREWCESKGVCCTYRPKVAMGKTNI
ncbi:hypothetical protein BGW36DRAFT_126892 [Talaromyces proteolyticus]|uniref:Structure-specific endonuclease subunit SLX4 n=1 Tax=Talaromyces proteolyticus TaxID=1131652 RepID=A0AAD4Q003_9EURO|nr:uncharacterized protein BGW36DRAFT_126892 [Talaromyces proteolyticus]KAH8700324.1 hypothetical protein BGW36DRAFT_126892 [Talaromyces proteolyticus]